LKNQSTDIIASRQRHRDTVGKCIFILIQKETEWMGICHYVVAIIVAATVEAAALKNS